MKYVLQLKTEPTASSDGVWKDWLSLRNSSLTNAGIGLFAEREFALKMPIGYYIGPTVWKSDVLGGNKPSDAYFRQHDIRVADDPMGKYDLAYLDNKCFYRLVRPLPLTHGGPGQSLYMGFHYTNSYTQTFAEKSARREKKRGNNVVLREDGMVQASKLIRKDTELFVGYEEDEANDPEERQAAAEERKSAAEKSKKLST